MNIILLMVLAVGSVECGDSVMTHFSGQTKKGLDIMMTGDYGVMYDFLFQAKRTFQTMDDVLGAASNETNPWDLSDFMILAGDNIYPMLAEHPTDKEFDSLLALFQTENLRNLDLYPIRGNHDCKFDKERELKLSEQWEKWRMPYYYFKEEYPIGNGKKFAVLYVDSCFMECSTYSYAEDAYTGPVSNGCSDEDIQFGNEQYEWIKNVLYEWDLDEDIVWKASVQHHMIFGKHYDDKNYIIDNFMPMLMDHNFDLFLNGHEHFLAYANQPYYYIPSPSQSEENWIYRPECKYMTETFFGKEEVRYQEFVQGEVLHQVTSAISGSPGYQLCEDLPTSGNFLWAQNRHLGWNTIHVDEDEVVIRYKGIWADSRELIDLYQVRITAKSALEVQQ